MNRNAKIQKLYDKRLKRARAKLKTSNKERYISKADRAEAAKEAESIAQSEGEAIEQIDTK